ncbi:MAG TPA: isoprenylcysteine carboxylmethyltransferase family protein [Ilumatobacteraceae bacterium]
MRKSSAAIGTTFFLLVAPGVVAGLVPWLITRWQIGHRGSSPWVPARILGVALIALGAGALLLAFWRFVAEGVGTPAPVAPTQRLVVGGMYRYVRNPMYLAVASIIVGQAGLLGQPGLLIYAAGFVLVVSVFVAVYEEPTLRHQFGDEYVDYCRGVPRWLPRLTPWDPEGDAPDAG